MDNAMLQILHKAAVKACFENANRFLSKEFILSSVVKEDDWGDTAMASQVFENMLAAGDIEKTAEGYCKTGHANQIRQTMAKPSLTRTEFDKLSPARKIEFVNAGGRIG